MSYLVASPEDRFSLIYSWVLFDESTGCGFISYGFMKNLRLQVYPIFALGLFHPLVINWINPFVILRVSGVFFQFISFQTEIQVSKQYRA